MDEVVHQSGSAVCAKRLNPPRCRSSCRRAREPSEPLRRSSLSCLHDNAGMTLVIPSAGVLFGGFAENCSRAGGSLILSAKVWFYERASRPRARTTGPTSWGTYPFASWAHIPPCQRVVWRSWTFRLASKAHLGLKRPLCCHTLPSKRRRLRHLRPTCQQRRQRYRAFCVRAACLSAAVVRSTMN